MKKMKERLKNIKLNYYSEYYNQFGICQMFLCVSLRTMTKQLKVIQRLIKNSVEYLKWSVLQNTQLVNG